MIKHLLAAVACLLLCGNAFAAANGIELNFNDDSVQGRYLGIINQDAYGTSMLDARLLYNDEDDIERWLASLGLDFVGEPGNIAGLELGIAVDGKLGDTDVQDTEIGAIGVGALVRYYPPALGGFGFGGRLIYSPEIFCFMETERVTEFSARLGYAVTPKIGLHVEYQKVRVEYELYGKADFDEEVRFGFEARF